MMVEEEEETGKCSHYQRKCSLLAPCCQKIYQCRICHDDDQNHTLNRQTVEVIVCSQCQKKQKVQRNCEDCGILFGKYSCLICRLFDDKEKGQFHCDGCGLCRVGGREKFFHCPKCNMCIAINLKETHKCLENISRRNCPVCLEDIHTSRKSIHVPDCTHLLHGDCLQGMLKHGSSSCPICNKSLIDMTEHWKLIDNEIEHTLMPQIYRDYKVNVLCRDCHEETKAPFHVLGLKCQACGSYNTTRIGGDDPLPTDNREASESEGEDLVNIEEIAIESDSGNSWETLSNDELFNDEDENDTSDRTSVENISSGDYSEETLINNENLNSEDEERQEIESGVDDRNIAEDDS